MYFLCACVEGDVWLVHRGSYKGTGDLDENEPFDEKDLVVKNVSTEAWNMKDRRRLRTSSAVNTMRVLMQSKDRRWHLLCEY